MGSSKFKVRRNTVGMGSRADMSTVIGGAVMGAAGELGAPPPSRFGTCQLEDYSLEKNKTHCSVNDLFMEGHVCSFSAGTCNGSCGLP